MFCCQIPLIHKQAVIDPVSLAAMKPIRLAQNSLLDKAEVLGDGATASVGGLTGDLDSMHLVLLKGIPVHSAACLRDNAFPLHRRVEPVAQFDGIIPSVQAIVQHAYQTILISDPQVILR
jgi:hypothetical protein